MVLGQELQNNVDEVNGGWLDIGETAVITVEGTVGGEGVEPGDIITNQAGVKYNDRDLEHIQGNVSAYNYSPLASFTLKDYGIVNGRVWVDSDNAGTITEGERLVAGATVEMVDENGNVVNDLHGSPQVTTTNNEGYYTFKNIVADIYYIRYQLEGYQVTQNVVAAENGNKAVKNGEYAMIGPLDYSLSLDDSELSQIMYLGQNIGVLPVVTAAKATQVPGKDPQQGTAEAPAQVTEAEPFNYVITVTNHGTNANDVITGAVVEDTIPEGLIIDTDGITPAGWVFGEDERTIKWEDQTFEMGSNLYTIPVTVVPSSAKQAIVYVNAATVTMEERDEETETPPIYNKVEPPEIQLVKSAVVTGPNNEELSKEDGTEQAPVSVYPDNKITYTIRATNLDGNSITGFTIEDKVPDGLLVAAEDTSPPGMTVEQREDGTYVVWQNQALGPNQHRDYVFTTTIDLNKYIDGLLYLNTATLIPPEGWDTENYPIEDSNTTHHQLVAKVALQITKTINQPSAEDETFIYQIDYAPEAGGQTSKSFYATITVPAGETATTISILELTPGQYTVTELDSNWRYAIDENATPLTQVYPLNGHNRTGTANYLNNRILDTWVSDKASVSNHMDDI
ncbi:DUF11 domain-containing protein [Ruminococcaceae bacterium OttesenSCG-928-A16]|nr:DUF11 domain-containing protein [Ruminococcaceae bacterium OttesenSCG-928-A16]